MNRRAMLLSTFGLALTARPAFARPPFTISGDSVPLLSPQFHDGAGRNLTLDVFAGRVILLNI